MLYDGLGVGELRQQFRRHERRNLDLAHAGGVFGFEPGDLGLGRHDVGDALQPVTHPDFADLNTLGHLCVSWAVSVGLFLLARTG